MVYCDTSFFLRQLVPGEDRAEAIEVSRNIERTLGSIPLTNFTRLEVIQALRFEIWRNRNDRTRDLPADPANAALNLFLAEIGQSLELRPLSGTQFSRRPNCSRVPLQKMAGALSIYSMWQARRR